MGYTHYWTTNDQVSIKAWNEFISIVRKLIESSGITIRAGDGHGEPIITKTEVFLNGDGENDLDHETFAIVKDSGKWDFCKTARKPYDAVVVAALMEAERLEIISEWSSDGDAESGDFDAAIELIQKIS
jgi:hypothetical protein